MLNKKQKALSQAVSIGTGGTKQGDSASVYKMLGFASKGLEKVSNEGSTSRLQWQRTKLGNSAGHLQPVMPELQMLLQKLKAASDHF